MLDSNSPPHLVLDATRAGLASETVKSFTSALGIPTGKSFVLVNVVYNAAIVVTVSGSYGQQGDLRQWRNLQQNEEEYLVQISPPGDLLPEMIRTLVSNQNITNAAIIFDDTFGKPTNLLTLKTYFLVN